MAFDVVFIPTCIIGMSNTQSVMTGVTSYLSHAMAPCANKNLSQFQSDGKFVFIQRIQYSDCYKVSLNTLQLYCRGILIKIVTMMTWSCVTTTHNFHQIRIMIYISKQRLVLFKTGTNHGDHYINQITWMLGGHMGGRYLVTMIPGRMEMYWGSLLICANYIGMYHPLIGCVCEECGFGTGSIGSPVGWQGILDLGHGMSKLCVTSWQGIS